MPNKIALYNNLLTSYEQSILYYSSDGLSLESVDSFRIALIASRFAESRGVKPQVAHTVALAPPDPAVRKASLANEVFATWAFSLASGNAPSVKNRHPPTPRRRRGFAADGREDGSGM